MDFLIISISGKNTSTGSITYLIEIYIESKVYIENIDWLNSVLSFS